MATFTPSTPLGLDCSSSHTLVFFFYCSVERWDIVLVDVQDEERKREGSGEERSSVRGRWVSERSENWAYSTVGTAHEQKRGSLFWKEKKSLLLWQKLGKSSCQGLLWVCLQTRAAFFFIRLICMLLSRKDLSTKAKSWSDEIGALVSVPCPL